MEEPILKLNSNRVTILKSELQDIGRPSSRSFAGNADWRAKASLQKRRDALKIKIRKEKKKIRAQFKQDLEKYQAHLQQEKALEEEALEQFKGQSPIATISISDPVVESEPIEEIKVNPITEIDL